MSHPFQTDADMMDFDEAAETIVEEQKPEVGLELHVGSNIFRTTNGIIKLQGKEQIVLEVQSDPPALLLTMDFYDAEASESAISDAINCLPPVRTASLSAPPRLPTRRSTILLR